MRKQGVPTFLQWWTSHDVDDRTSMLRRAHADREAIFSLMRFAYAAGLAANSLTTKPVDVQKARKVDDKPDANCEAHCTRRYHDSDCRHHP